MLARKEPAARVKFFGFFMRIGVIRHSGMARLEAPKTQRPNLPISRDCVCHTATVDQWGWLNLINSDSNYEVSDGMNSVGSLANAILNRAYATVPAAA